MTQISLLLTPTLLLSRPPGVGLHKWHEIVSIVTLVIQTSLFTLNRERISLTSVIHYSPCSSDAERERFKSFELNKSGMYSFLSDAH